ncbi:MAG: N-6 DNA methylase [Candidatus Eisenbacteria bacterium]|nr:N-6 DNA methylase [Candidatus Eisenbacteria bacterium]
MTRRPPSSRKVPDSRATEIPQDEIGVGYVRDFVSGIPVRATPEETQAVQVFARRLVEDLGYPKSHIITRPQYRVRRRPSETKKSYPVDIAVFSKARKHEEDLILLVECKSPNIKVGRRQLEIYLTMSEAKIGVWYSGRTDIEGDSHLYIRKDYLPGGKIVFEQIPTLPRFGQRLEDVGRYLRKDLIISEQLKSVLRDIRNHLAGMTTGTTRDEQLARQTINVLFCKVYDETSKGPEELVEFRAGVNEPSTDVKDRVLDLFARVKKRYSDVFDPSDTIELDDDSIAYVVGELQSYCVTESKRDVVGDAFEVFMGPALRGEEGQFFTPRNVVHMIVDILDPEPEETIIDPACGSGGFLIAGLDRVWAKVEARGKRKKWSGQRIREEQTHLASNYFRGLDKDRFLAKVTKAYMAILGDGRGGVFCENSLLPPSKWEPLTQSKVKLESFEVVMTNPPFGTKIPIKGAETLGQYVLGHRAKLNKKTGKYEWTSKVSDKEPPQLLFIERCIQLLKPGGRMGIVIPESILGMPTYTHIVQFLRSRVRVVGVVSMPEELFQPHTHAKTAVLFVKNVPPEPDDTVFMSVVEWCGHDSRGNPTIRILPDGGSVLLDDVPKVPGAFRAMVKDFK